jgi:medium-chain acyl-[acyl-carrier-protein] hydrolase
MSAAHILFCLPNAGGFASTYLTWGVALKPRVRIRPVSLPGRERLHHLAPCRDTDSIVEQILPAIAAELDQPYSIFGHSMGALVAYELTCALRDNGHREPARLFVSAYPPAHVPRRQAPVHDASEAVLLDVVRGFGGTSEDLLASREYVEFMMPMMRADLAVIETYRFTPRPPLTCPVLALAGEDDRIYPPDTLDGWRDLTVGRFDKRVFQGGHFYLHEHRKALLDYLRVELATP